MGAGASDACPEGGSDLQVAVTDNDLLKAAIAGRPNSEAHLFPKLKVLAEWIRKVK